MSRRPLLNRRLAGLGTTIFAEMSARAVATGSINLGQGFPDRDGPAEIAQAAADAIMAGRGNQYPPGPGVPELRQAIAAHDERFYGLHYDPADEILVTAGATEAIAAAMLALVEPGDEVIAFEPYYDSYAANIAMAGGVRVPVTLRPPGFRPDIYELAKAVTSKTRLILLNSPHNPTGTVFGDQELAAIARLTVERDLLVVTNEVYEHLAFDVGHVPIAQFPGMRERTVSVSSAGKTFAFTGWKIGWVKAAPELVAAVKTAKQFLTFVSGGPFQYAVAQALALPDAYYDKLRDDLVGTARPASPKAWTRSASGSTRRRARTSSPPTSGRWAMTTAWSSAGCCRTAPAWSPSPPRSSTTTPKRPAATSGSPSASSPRC